MTLHFYDINDIRGSVLLCFTLFYFIFYTFTFTSVVLNCLIVLCWTSVNQKGILGITRMQVGCGWVMLRQMWVQSVWGGGVDEG